MLGNGSTGFGSWQDAVVWLRDQPEQAQLVLDAFFDDPLTEASARYRASTEWGAISKLLHGRSGRALDVGAGRGIASYALAREGFRVSALEPDPSVIVGAAAIRQLAHEANLPIEVVEQVAECLPFNDATFDVVFARAVLHHTVDLDATCREMYRVLKPGGICLAVREHVISREADLPVFLSRHPLHRLYGREHAFLLGRYVEALQEAGFARLEVLGPFETAINLYPHTVSTLKRAIANWLEQKLPTGFWGVLFSSENVFRLALAVAAHFDNRPGRLYSFVGHKVAS